MADGEPDAKDGKRGLCAGVFPQAFYQGYEDCPIAGRTRAAEMCIRDSYYTDHMLIIDHDEEQGWHDARIVPYEPLQIDPAAMVLHYAMESFEGMKAYRTPDGSIQLFRPDKNAQRMINTNHRMCLPSLPVEDFVQRCV